MGVNFKNPQTHARLAQSNLAIVRLLEISDRHSLKLNAENLKTYSHGLLLPQIREPRAVPSEPEQVRRSLFCRWSRLSRWNNGSWEKILPRPHPTGLARWADLRAGYRAAAQSPGSSFSIPGTGVGYRKSGVGCLVLLASIPATIAIGRWLVLACINLDAT
jgi:hypothetical protein